MNQEFIWPTRVCYQDTDAGGVVYFVNYLKFFERARTEWMNYLGVDSVALLNHGITFVVKKTEADFAAPARLNDRLEIVSRISQLRSASLAFEQTAYLRGERKKDLCRGTVKLACLAQKSLTPCRLPLVIMEMFRRAC